jgi:hypothetical protein
MMLLFAILITYYRLLPPVDGVYRIEFAVIDLQAFAGTLLEQQPTVTTILENSTDTGKRNNSFDFDSFSCTMHLSLPVGSKSR